MIYHKPSLNTLTRLWSLAFSCDKRSNPYEEPANYPANDDIRMETIRHAMDFLKHATKAFVIFENITSLKTKISTPEEFHIILSSGAQINAWQQALINKRSEASKLRRKINTAFAIRDTYLKDWLSEAGALPTFEQAPEWVQEAAQNGGYTLFGDLSPTEESRSTNPS